jgi:hypothetical protein
MKAPNNPMVEADRILASQLMTIAQDVSGSADYIATLENELETLEASPANDFDYIISYTRYQLANAMDQHRAFVEDCDKRIKQAWEEFRGRIAAAESLQGPTSAPISQ